MGYRIYIDCAGDCPNDPNFVHENMMGPVCVPRDMPFSGRRAGLSRTNRQTYVEVPELDSGGIWQWDGGCDKAGITIPARIEEQNRRRARGVPAIVLKVSESDGRDVCPTCSARVLIKADGHLRRHRRPDKLVCAGSDALAPMIAAWAR